MRSLSPALPLRPRSRVALLAAGPVLGAAIGAITNVLTNKWNWWLFVALTVLVGAGAVAAIIPGVQSGVSNSYGVFVRRRRLRLRRKNRTPRVNTLPRDVTDFTGRQEIVSQIIGAIKNTSAAPGRTAIYSIEGMGGVGKTSLAVHIAHRIAQDYLDAVLFIDLRAHNSHQEPIGAYDALGILLDNIGVPGQSIPGSLQGRASLWRRELADSHVLVVLDNASGLNQVRDLIAGGIGCSFIITSRRRLVELEGASSVSLDALSPSEATTLFMRVLGMERSTGQGEEIDRVVQRLYCIPLAIRLMAARLRAHPTWAVGDLLKQDLALTRESRLESIYNLSYGDLTYKQKSFFRLLAIHPGLDITTEAAAVFAGVSHGESIELMDQLYSRYLVEEPIPHRFKLHDLIKEFASQEMSAMHNDDNQREALLKLLSYYTFMATAASRLIGAHDIVDVGSSIDDPEIPLPQNNIESLAWFAAELGNLLACAHYAIERALFPYAWQLPASMMSYLRSRGLVSQIVSLLDGALHAVIRMHDKAGEAHIRRRFGHMSRLQGNFEASLSQLQKSFELSEELEGRQSIAWCHHELGHLYRVTNDPVTAVEHFSVAIAIHRELENRIGVMTSETGLAIVLHASNETDAARQYFEDAILIAREVTDRRAEAAALFELGALETDVENYETARRFLIDALTVYDEAGNRAGQADCHLNVARVDRLTGHYDTVKRNLAEAVNIYVELGYRRREADTYYELAENAGSSGDNAMALVHRERADRIYSELRLTRSRP